MVGGYPRKPWQLPANLQAGKYGVAEIEPTVTNIDQHFEFILWCLCLLKQMF